LVGQAISNIKELESYFSSQFSDLGLAT